MYLASTARLSPSSEDPDTSYAHNLGPVRQRAMPIHHPPAAPEHAEDAQRRFCGQGRDRTADLTIFSRALFRLSYLTRDRPGLDAAPGLMPPEALRKTHPGLGRCAELTGFEPATFTLTG
jgi:hypothetical protein